jgi:Tfp pilus assembly protein PilX
MKFAILQVSLRESEKKRKTVVVAPTRRKKKMKKFAGIVMALLVVGSLAFALSPESVKISTTIAQTAKMTINEAAVTDGDLTSSDYTEQTLADSGYGTEFFVNTRSNTVNGFTLSYTMSPLSSTTTTNKIPVTVKTLVDGAGTGTETPITSANAGIAQTVLSKSSSSGMENHSIGVFVEATSSTWKTDVAAGSYTANLTFTFTAN